MKPALPALPKPILVLLWASLALYVTTLPAPHTIALRNVAFVIMLATTVFTLVRYRLKPEFPFAIPWTAYATVAFVSVLYAVDREYSWRDFVSEIGYGILVLVFAATWGRARPMLNGLIAIVTVLSVVSLVLLLSLYPFSAIWNVSDLHREAITNPLARIGINSNFHVSVMPLIGLGAWRLWQSGRRYLATAMIVLLFADLGALLLSANRQNMIVVALCLLCVTAFLPRSTFTRQRVLTLCALIFVLAAFFMLQLLRRAELQAPAGNLLVTAVQGDPRWDLWRFSIEKIIEHPWQGGGFGRGVFDKLYADYRPEYTSLWHAHNMFLNKGIQMGFPGIIAFACLWVALFRKLVVLAKAAPPINEIAIAGLAIAVGVFMKSMTDDFFCRDPALLFWLQMGILLGEMQRLKDNEP